MVRLAVIIISLAMAPAPAVAAGSRSCESLVSRLSSLVWKPSEELRLLQEAAKGTGHTVSFNRGAGHVKIGLLSQNQVAFGSALANAIRKGDISRIDAGLVIGPRVIPMLQRLAKTTPNADQLSVSGYMDVSQIFNLLASQTRIKKTDQLMEFSESEYASISQSLELMNVRQACEKFYQTSDLRRCRVMKFEFKAGKLDEIEWFPSPDDPSFF